MKKLVLSLLGAATLATASNAMAIDSTRVYSVNITTGGNLIQTFAGAAFFDFDSENFNLGGLAPTIPPLGVNPAGAVFPGSCVYSLQWIDQGLNQLLPPGAAAGNVLGTNAPGPLALSAQAWVGEQMSHGNGSCFENALRQVPSIVTLANGVAYGPSFGFTQFGQLNTIATLSLGESFFPDPALIGVIQFATVLGNQSIFGIAFRG
jgi:hypothetical protein